MTCRGPSPIPARVHERHAPSRHPWRKPARATAPSSSYRRASRRCRTSRSSSCTRCSAICAAARSRCGGVRSRPDSSESARRRRCSTTRSSLLRCWIIASRWLWRSSTPASGVIETPSSRTRMRPAPWPLLGATTPRRPATCSTHGARFCRSSAARWRRNPCSGGGFGSRGERTAARNRRWRSSSCSLPAS